MKEIRMVVIGFGGMGSRYATMIREGLIKGLILTGICCRNEAGQTVIRSEYPGVHIYQNIEDTFVHAKEFDAVLIVTSHDTHVVIGKEALSRGIHVFCDKPAGVSTKEVKELNRAADQSNACFAMMFNTRTKKGYQKAKEMLEAGALGSVSRAVWVCNTFYRTPCYHKSAPWRSTWSGERGGLLINQCQHFLDIWQWILGMPDDIYASIDYGKYNDFSVDDSVDLQFTYHNGLRGSFISASGESPGVNRLEIWGSKGRLTVENGTQVTFDENQISTLEFAEANTEIYGELPHMLKRVELEAETEPYQTMLQNFADHLLCGVPLLAPGKEGLYSVALANASYLSSWLDKKVSLPIDDELYEAMLAEK